MVFEPLRLTYSRSTVISQKSSNKSISDQRICVCASSCVSSCVRHLLWVYVCIILCGCMCASSCVGVCVRHLVWVYVCVILCGCMCASSCVSVCVCHLV